MRACDQDFETVVLLKEAEHNFYMDNDNNYKNYHHSLYAIAKHLAKSSTWFILFNLSTALWVAISSTPSL